MNDALTVVSWRSRPRSFVALMSLYESNYQRLAHIAGNLRALEGVLVSHVVDDCDLRLSVSERTPYTTSFDFTYLFGEAPDFTTYPDMRVRVYHDARLVEAQEWAAHHDHSQLRRIRGLVERELDQRWARNTMLNKWLEYCIDRGHRFRT
jgi:uncharacterized protein YqiB (DUF1249 family)